MTAKRKVAGNAEMRHERLLGVSRLDGRRSGEGGQRRGWWGKRRGAPNIKVRGEAAAAATTTNGGGWMKQIGAAEKMKLELTTNGSRLKERDGSGGEEEREAWEGERRWTRGGSKSEMEERGRSRG